MYSPPPMIVGTPEEALTIEAFGDQMVLHLGTKQTDGRFCLWTNITPPGGGPPPHYHENEDELFWPISGNAEFLIDNQWTTFPAKSAIYAPRRSIHTYRNPNPEPLQMLIQTIPGGFDEFFAECAIEFARPEAPKMEKLVEISARFGIHYVN